MAGYIGSKASVVSSGAERKKTFAITTATTVLSGLSYTPQQVHVFHNGVRLIDGTDFTATDGASLTLASAAQSGDEVVVISYATFQVSDTVSASAGGTFTGDVSVTGAATFSGAFTSKGIDDNAAATAMTIDASGNVGIGTASPARGPLHLNAASGSAEIHMTTTGNGTASTDGLTIFAGDSVGSGGAGVWYRENGPLRFATNATEAMRIDSSGNVLVGTAAPITGIYNASPLNVQSAGNTAAVKCTANTNAGTTLQSIRDTSGLHLVFWQNGATVGSISTTASNTTYTTSSDYRLKETITPVQGAADIVKAMQPVTYTFKSDGSWHDGFLAHELQELHPRAVIGSKDAMKDEEYEVTPAVLDEEGNVVTEAVMGTRSVPDYQGVDYSKLTPILTAALQEALNKIDALEARVAALEL